jgi:hypothetical protein
VIDEHGGVFEFWRTESFPRHLRHVPTTESFVAKKDNAQVSNFTKSKSNTI